MWKICERCKRRFSKQSESMTDRLISAIQSEIDESDARGLILDELMTMKEEGTDDMDALASLFDTLLFDSGLEEDGKAEVKKAQAIFEEME